MAEQLRITEPVSAVTGEARRDGAEPLDTRRQLARLFEALPPHALEAEMALLGAMLWDPRVIGDVIQVVRNAEDFFKPAHGVIFQTLVELYDQTGQVDIVQLNQRLADRAALDAVGGVGYLIRLAESVPTAAHSVEHARLVRDKSMIRQLIDAAGRIIFEAHHSPLEVKAILEQAEARIFAIAQRNEHASAESLRDLLTETMQRLETSDGRQITGIPTGYLKLDELTSGFQRSEMIVIAARPSMGKTALALNVAEQMAMAGHPVAVFSLEMSRQQLVQRLLCARAAIDSHRFRRNMLAKEDWSRLMVACGELEQAPIYIDDTPSLSLLQMRSKARRLKERHNIDAVIIDYLQLMSSGTRIESRQLEVAEISRGIKAMARELEVPVVCLSQLNRASEQREGHKPRMSDLRESGSIEQDADVVAMLHREEYYHLSDPGWSDANPDKIGVAELIVAKQRNGPTDVVELRWDSQCMRFRNLSYASAPSDAGDRHWRNEPVPFSPGGSRGPVADHRDGGGPERE